MTGSAVRLEVVAGKAAGASIVVEDELLIGRYADGVGRLDDDDEISRSHARVSVDSSGFGAIEDLGSTNGTFVNGLRISSPRTLSLGDTIEIGATTVIVREVPVAGGPEQPPRTETLEHSAVPAIEPELPVLSLRVEVDFAGREARVSLSEGSEPVRFTFEDGAWRSRAAGPGE